MEQGTGTFLGGLAGGALGMIGNIFGVGMTNDQNKELVEQQNKLNIEQWNRENAYNAPIEQMRRLKAAGLNPNLIYGNGAGSLISAPSPEMQAAHMQAPQVDPLTMAQIANLNAQTKATEDNNNRENEKQPLTLEKLSQDVDFIKQNINESRSRVSLNSVTEHLNSMLSKKAQAEAMEHFENYRYLERSLDYRLDDIMNVAHIHGLESVELNTRLNYLDDTLRQTYNNLVATYDLINSQSSAQKALSYYHYEKGSVEFSNAVSNRINADAHALSVEGKLKEIAGQLERWDDMTLNERIGLSQKVVDLGNEIYSGRQVTEKVTTEKGGGKPNKTTSTYTRKRPKVKLSQPIRFLK